MQRAAWNAQTVTSHALAAVVAAVYETRGLAAAGDFVARHIAVHFEQVDVHETVKLQHPKFLLATFLAQANRPPPEARLLRESGRHTHMPTFVVGVYSGSTCLAEGYGSSIARAVNDAARRALLAHYVVELRDAPLPSEMAGYTHADERVQFRGESDMAKSQQRA